MENLFQPAGSRGALWFSQTKADLELPGKQTTFPVQGKGGLRTCVAWVCHVRPGHSRGRGLHRMPAARRLERELKLCVEVHHPLSSNKAVCTWVRGDFGFRVRGLRKKVIFMWRQ